MRPFSGVSSITLREIAQSLLEGKRMARSIENMADTFVPLVEAPDTDTLERLAHIRNSAQHISQYISDIYSQIAREAMRGE